jgi:hypothetical protein
MKAEDEQLRFPLGRYENREPVIHTVGEAVNRPCQANCGCHGEPPRPRGTRHQKETSGRGMFPSDGDLPAENLVGVSQLR